jgi:hypothetical protein
MQSLRIQSLHSPTQVSNATHQSLSLNLTQNLPPEC